MRILQVTPTFFSENSVIGGGERYVNNVCAAIQMADNEHRLQCDILSFGTNRSSTPIGLNSILQLYPANPDNLLSCAGEELDAILADYDVVHIHQCLTPWGIFIGARARVLGACVLGTDHGGGEAWQLEAYPVITNVFDAFHAQSSFAKSAFWQFSAPCHLIFGPVDETIFPLNSALRNPAQIVAIGRILPHKGYENAIAALPERARLTIIGRNHDNNYFEFLQQCAQDKNVVFRTDLDDKEMVEIIRNAGLLLHTGVHVGYNGQFYAKPELLSLAPLEAMCAGTPAIVSQAGALPELASVGGCHVYRTPEELAEKLRQHMADKLFSITPGEIREATIARYGLLQFGHAYLQLIARER